MNVTRTWLYVRSHQTVRVVLDGADVKVFGPGGEFSHSRFADAMDAALQQAVIEEILIRDGYTLEQLTTERRSGLERRGTRRGTDRRRELRLVVG